MPVGVLDEVDAAGQLIADEPGLPVAGFALGKVLGGQGHVGGVVPQMIGLGAAGLPAQLQLEGSLAVPQEAQLPAPVGHGQLPLDGQAQVLAVKGGAALQIQHPQADVRHGGHGRVSPFSLAWFGCLYSIIPLARGQERPQIFPKRSKPPMQKGENRV